MANKAIVVGIGDYLNIKKYPQLNYSVNDAKEVFNILCKETYSIFDEHHSILILNPTLENLINEISRFFDYVLPNDLVLFYFAGHSEVIKGKSFHLAVRDSCVKSNLISSSTFNIESLLPFLREKDIEKYILVLDSCRSGKVIDTPGFINRGNKYEFISEELNSNLSGYGKIVVAASQHYELAKESEELKHGIFTYYFLKGIRNGINPEYAEQFISIRDIYKYINRNIRQIHHNITQKPIFSGQHEKGELYITKNPNYTLSQKVITNTQSSIEEKSQPQTNSQSKSIPKISLKDKGRKKND